MKKNGFILDELVILFGAIAVACAFAFSLIALCYHIDNVPVRCFVDDKLVFDGRSACIDVESSGSTTKVSISGGLMCIWPKEYYVSNNVRLEGVKK